ncbi:hypothetical protein ET1_01_00100 [Edwardsiella tarda ATCC 15947 = NBRC 105688]|nr:hypothetical protein ET1_01_00100 [Edwardsiella tarda ATCC 15947 = NBRC 105688]
MNLKSPSASVSHFLYEVSHQADMPFMSSIISLRKTGWVTAISLLNNQPIDSAQHISSLIFIVISRDCPSYPCQFVCQSAGDNIRVSVTELSPDPFS